jgi:hypothetical protein
MLGAIPAWAHTMHASRLAKEEPRFPPGYYEFVIDHTDNSRRAVLAAPGYDLPGERQADGVLPPRERTVRDETHHWQKAGGSERCPRCR